MRGGIVGDVGVPPARGGEYLAWEPHSHMAFRFNEASTGSIAAFAEDYRIVTTANGCRLTWVMATKPKFLYNLREYSNKRFTTTA
jgi:hypothetical protein